MTSLSQDISRLHTNGGKRPATISTWSLRNSSCAKHLQERLELLAELPLLEITEDALALAQHFLRVGAIPESYPEDALHVAIAVSNGVEFLLTWNYKHLANAVMRGKIEAACREAGYMPVIICTPEELMEVQAMPEDPIVAQVRQVRAAHAAEFNNDLVAIYRDLKRQERKSRRQFVTYPARRITPVKQSNPEVEQAA